MNIVWASLFIVGLSLFVGFNMAIDREIARIAAEEAKGESHE